jgi:niacin transporter
MREKETRLISMVIAALLCAIGIVIPMFAPRIFLEPASFTLASHVPIFIALFISPPVALAVSIGTTLGFFFAGFPIVIVLRALSHVVFAMTGAEILKRNTNLLSSFGKTTGFGLLLAVIHAVCEVTVVTLFYFGSHMPTGYYSHGYLTSVLLLVGVGTIVHSMIDYGIAIAVWKPLRHVIQIPVNAREVLIKEAVQQ